MNEPISYNMQSYCNYMNMQPSDVKGKNNSAVMTNKRYLYNKLYSKFIFSLPKTWDLNFFRYWLFWGGSIGVIYTKQYGWVCQPYSVSKINLYYNPLEIMIYNSFITTPRKGIIGVNAEIIKCFDDYFGFDDIVTRYAVKLSNIDKAINVNLMNANVSALFEAESKKQADEIKTAYGKATEGEPLVVVNKSVTQGQQLTTLLKDVKNNYIVSDLLADRRAVVNEFLTEIGIANANYSKRERLNSAEVNQNNEETQAIIDVVYDNLKDCFEKVKKISGLDISVKLRKENDNDNSIWDATV